MQAFFIHTIRQSWHERYNNYMSLPKEKLAEMLAESDKITNPDACKEFEPTEETESIATISNYYY